MSMLKSSLASGAQIHRMICGGGVVPQQSTCGPIHIRSVAGGLWRQQSSLRCDRRGAAWSMRACCPRARRRRAARPALWSRATAAGRRMQPILSLTYCRRTSQPRRHMRRPSPAATPARGRRGAPAAAGVQSPAPALSPAPAQLTAGCTTRGWRPHACCMRQSRATRGAAAPRPVRATPVAISGHCTCVPLARCGPRARARRPWRRPRRLSGVRQGHPSLQARAPRCCQAWLSCMRGGPGSSGLPVPM